MRGQSRWLLLSIAVIVIDQIVKDRVNHFLLQIISYPVCPGLSLTLVYNHGAAFGFLANAGGWQLYAFIAIALCVLVGMVWWLTTMRSSQRWQAIAVALVLGGAMGNLIDRVVRGYVIDYIDVYVGQYHWPAFNIADSAICVGAIMLIWQFWRGK